MCLKYYPGNYVKVDDHFERLKEIYGSQRMLKELSELDPSNHCRNGGKKRLKIQGIFDIRRLLLPG